MTGEGEVWEEIGDALHQLAEQGQRLTEQSEKQTALLKEMAEWASRRE